MREEKLLIHKMSFWYQLLFYT